MDKKEILEALQSVKQDFLSTSKDLRELEEIERKSQLILDESVLKDNIEIINITQDSKEFSKKVQKILKAEK